MPDLPPHPDGEMDLGPPILELRNLDLDPGMDFAPGVRRRINRRNLAQHTVDFGFGGLTVFVKEYLSIIMESVRGQSDR